MRRFQVALCGGVTCAAAAAILAPLDVPAAYLSDFAACHCGYFPQDTGSELLVFWPQGGDALYVVEHFAR